MTKLARAAPIELPREYTTFLRFSNGGGGDLGLDPGWFQLWPCEEVMKLNRDYEIDKWIPGFFGFGSNGGGELFAFDVRTDPPWPIVMIPFIPMEAEEAQVIARSIREFIEAIGYEWDDN